MNSRLHIKLFVFTAAVVLVGAAVALAEISPNPVKFSGAGVKTVVITNTSARTAIYKVSIVPSSAPFHVPNAKDCSHVQPNGRCVLRVSYSPSGAAQDRATLRVLATGQPVQQADLIGKPGSGDGGGGGGNGPNCTLHVARHQKLVKHAHGKTVRSPYAVSLTSSEDGQVTAQAVGKTAKGKTIFLENANAVDTAGNGVVLKLKLGRKSENLIRSDLAAGHSPKMTLSASCSTDAGATPVSAKIHFSDAKHGKGFKLPLEADANVK